MSEFYIITTRHRSLLYPGTVLFWGPDRGGYSSILERAGRYSEEEALSIQNVRGGDYMIPCRVVDAEAMRVVDLDKLKSLVPSAVGSE